MSELTFQLEYDQVRDIGTAGRAISAIQRDAGTSESN